MAGKATIIKVQENIPVLGTPKYADIVEGNFGPQLKLNGTWDGVQGYGTVYVHEACANAMRALGILTDQNGKLAIVGSPRIQILRANKRTDVTLATGAAPATNGTANANGHVVPAQQQYAESPGKTFSRLKLTLAACLKASREAWTAALPAGESPGQDVVATAGLSLFIAADRRNCLSPLPKPPAGPITDAQKAEIDSVSECLATRHAWTRDRLTTEILGAAKATDMHKLTEPEAKAAITFLLAKLRELDAAAQVAAQAQQERAAATGGASDEEIPW